MFVLADASDEKSSEGQDPYFKNKDPANEHENFKDAEDRLDKKHREKIEKVRILEEWLSYEILQLTTELWKASQ